MARITEKFPTANANRIRDRRGAEGPSQTKMMQAHQPSEGPDSGVLKPVLRTGLQGPSGRVPAPEIRARTGSCPTRGRPRRTAARGTSRGRSTRRGGGWTRAFRSPAAAMNGDERIRSAARPTPVSGSSPSGAGSRSARRAKSSSGSIPSCRPRIRASPAADRRTLRPGRVEERVRDGVDAGLDLARLTARVREPGEPARRGREEVEAVPAAPLRGEALAGDATGSSAPARNRTTSSPRDGAEGSKDRGSRTFVRAAKRPERVTPIHVPPATRSRPASRPSRPCQKPAGSEGRATNSSRFAATTRG